ncbi:MAG: SPFH domain-containing protein [bacterium]|nr:SPFH domain-containing protein [bacterium]
MINLPAIVITIFVCFFLEKFILLLARILGFYAIIHEREAKVYVLFGEIIGTLETPGFHFLWPALGWRALFVNWLGRCYTRDLGLGQEYIRSIPVNSEEGTPMGIGVWYEMFISDPAAHIFKNVDPQGSLTANVKNATIKSLSNLPLAEMLINRHEMSRVVRKEVSDESSEWGYKLGSVYIRKVHFRDALMTKQIQEKVVNQLRQVTSAIEQDGLNQVNVIASKAEQEASIEFAKAAAVRPQVVGETLNTISQNPEVLATMFKILEYQRISENQNELTLVPEGSSGLLTPLLAAEKK